jgi:hypothetical protein
VDDNIKATCEMKFGRIKMRIWKHTYKDHNLFYFSNKMLFIWDGNHHFKAWYENINKTFGHANLHIKPKSIVLDGQKDNHAFITSLCDDINI